MSAFDTHLLTCRSDPNRSFARAISRTSNVVKSTVHFMSLAGGFRAQLPSLFSPITISASVAFLFMFHDAILSMIAESVGVQRGSLALKLGHDIIHSS